VLLVGLVEMRRVCDFKEERPQSTIIEWSIDSKAPPEVRRRFRIIGLRGINPLNRHRPRQGLTFLASGVTFHPPSIAHPELTTGLLGQGRGAPSVPHGRVPDRRIGASSGIPISLWNDQAQGPHSWDRPLV